MQPILSSRTEMPEDRGALPTAPRCPVCTGVLIELRGFVRCTRCHFSMCAGCEGEADGGAWDAPG